MSEEPKIKPATFVAIMATFGCILFMLITAWCGDKMKELRTTIQVERAVKREQDAYLFSLQYRLAEANKLNGALELENETDCQ
jgi:hypothetical protein